MLYRLMTPLFLRLYFSVLGILLFCFFLVLALTNYFINQDQYKDFAQDVLMVNQHVQDLNVKGELKVDQLDEIARYTHFKLEWINQSGVTAIREDLFFLDRVNSVSIYDGPNDGFVGIVQQRNSKKFLLVRDDFPDEDLEKDPEEDFIINSGLVGGILLVIIGLGSVLAYPIYRLSRQVLNLVHSSEEIAQGNYASRSRVAGPAPLDRLAKSFNLMAEQVQLSMQERDVFSHAIAHELRTPLSRIQLALGIIKGRTLEKGVSELINDLDTYVSELHQLTDDILSLALLQHQPRNKDQAHLAQRTVNLMIQASNVIDSYRELYPSLDIRLTGQKDALVQGNQRQIQMALDNVVRNACRYASRQVAIEILVLQGQLQLQVSDDGCGIPEQDRDQVLLPFARLESSRDRQTGGSGLGLAIVNLIMKRNGQGVQITDSQWRGCKIILIF